MQVVWPLVEKVPVNEAELEPPPPPQAALRAATAAAARIDRIDMGFPLENTGRRL